jgi:hypothetical protein
VGLDPGDQLEARVERVDDRPVGGRDLLAELVEDCT